MIQRGNLHSKIIITQFQTKDVRLLSHLLQLLGLKYREIDMVDSYNKKKKVESLKIKRDTLQSSNPIHTSKKGKLPL